MSRKDYRAVAEAFAEAYAMLDNDPARKAALDLVRAKIADRMKADNAAFKRQVFYDACEPKGGNK